MSYQLIFQPYGESALLINWPQKIDPSVSNDVISFKNKIDQLKTDNIIDTVMTYASVLIRFDPLKTDFTSLSSLLKTTYESASKISISPTLWQIPVCYDSSYGLDLNQMAEDRNCTPDDIIQTHSSDNYRVYFIGFLPGFLYLGGLAKSLHTPRKAEPRLKIPEGSVAIGGEQTGIYPMESPGGWNIIGRTPIPFFNAQQDPPCFAVPGDQVQFKPIDRYEYETISRQLQSQEYRLHYEKI